MRDKNSCRSGLLTGSGGAHCDAGTVACEYRASRGGGGGRGGRGGRSCGQRAGAHSVTVKEPPSNFLATVSVKVPDAEATFDENESAGAWPPIVTDAEDVSKNVGGKYIETESPAPKVR
jgi:hypothetical protein